MAVDAAGNVYVTGGSENLGGGSSFATIKYDPDGNELWVARYHGPANGDRANAIAVDAGGNVYVTGDSSGVGTSFDYATVKYDPDGNELWVARYDGPENGEDLAKAIRVDAVGNVYVTGQSCAQFPPCNSDYATIKYDPDGNQLWVARYNGPADQEDHASSIAVDAAGNVCVTGESVGVEGLDYATIKYDPDGNELWVARYHGPATGGGATAIAVDAAGNVYVTGGNWSAPPNPNYATIKYDPDGSELWVARYSGPVNRSTAGAIAVDSAGNVYVTGGSWGDGTGSDYATVKYDPEGNELWVVRYNGPANHTDAPTAIAVDAAGNVHVTGLSCARVGFRCLNFDYATIKYDPDGNELWVARYVGPGDSEATSLALDAAGNVYVTGRSLGDSGNFEYATVKYVQASNQLHVAR